jgi:hypothetical protein
VGGVDSARGVDICLFPSAQTIEEMQARVASGRFTNSRFGVNDQKYGFTYSNGFCENMVLLFQTDTEITRLRIL